MMGILSDDEENAPAATTIVKKEEQESYGLVIGITVGGMIAILMTIALYRFLMIIHQGKTLFYCKAHILAT